MDTDPAFGVARIDVSRNKMLGRRKRRDGALLFINLEIQIIIKIAINIVLNISINVGIL